MFPLLLLSLVAALAAPGVQDSKQDKPTIPKDSIELTVIGCLKGRVLATVANRQTDVVTYGVSLARALTQAAEVVGEINGYFDTRDHTPERPGTTHGTLRLGARYTVGGWRGDVATVVGLTSRDPGIGFAAGFTYVFTAFQIP